MVLHHAVMVLVCFPLSVVSPSPRDKRLGWVVESWSPASCQLTWGGGRQGAEHQPCPGHRGTKVWSQPGLAHAQLCCFGAAAAHL
jgi:hypothetical protein